MPAATAVAAALLSFVLLAGSPSPALADTVLRIRAAGGGDYTSVQAAIDALAPQAGAPGQGHVTFLLSGPFWERVEVYANFSAYGIDFVGDPSVPGGPTGNLIAFNVSGASGPGTFGSWTTRVWADGFRSMNVGYANSADGYNAKIAGQSVALDIEADAVGIWDSVLYGAQDTLYTGRGRTFFDGLFINGTCDAIFGNGAGVFLNTTIRMNYTVTAHRGQPSGSTPGHGVAAYLFVAADVDSIGSAPAALLLGRPWGPLATTVWIDSKLGRGIASLGWDDWGHDCTRSPPKPGTTWCNETFYAEYQSTGPGADPSGRPWWTYQLTPSQGAQWTPAYVLGNWTPTPPPQQPPRMWEWAREAERREKVQAQAAKKAMTARGQIGMGSEGAGDVQYAPPVRPSSSTLPRVYRGDLVTVDASAATTCNVLDYGAVGDGAHNDTSAIQSAMNDCASHPEGGIVIFPPGHVFLSYALVANNPAGPFVISVEGVLRFANDTKGWNQGYSFCLTVNGGQSLVLTGGGVIDGQGAAWWVNQNGFRPGLVKTQSVVTVLVQNITAVDSPNHTLELYATFLELVDTTTFASIPCQSPAPPSSSSSSPSDRKKGAKDSREGGVHGGTYCAHNTDGVDLHHSAYAYVHRYKSSVGDDNIAIHGNNTLIEDCDFGFGHGCSIGSLGANTALQNITVRSSRFNNTEQAVRIKSDATGASGYLRNVVFTDLAMNNVGESILLTQFYTSPAPPSSSSSSSSSSSTRLRSSAPGDAASTAVGASPTLAITNVTFSNIVSFNAAQAGSFQCQPSVPCTDITVSNVTHTGTAPKKGWDCQAVHGSVDQPVTPALTCFST
jgi:pectinesterase